MDFGQQFIGVALVLALLGTALWWLRRRGLTPVLASRRSPSALELVERLPLGPQHTLHLVRVGESAMLVASSPGGCTLLQTLPWAPGASASGAAR